jgi:hypothetical protein
MISEGSAGHPLRGDLMGQPVIHFKITGTESAKVWVIESGE